MTPFGQFLLSADNNQEMEDYDVNVHLMVEL
jgi:hypothetical protein